jgi:hypothetical protein
VAQVVLNRVRHPAYPKSVCGVVFQGSERATGCQFTFTCDGAIHRAPASGLWARARRVAEEALSGYVYAPVGWATHYHTNWVVPYWSSSLVKLANVGTHIFYRWEGGWGRAPAFRFASASIEPQIGLMRRLTSDPTTLADAPTVDEAAALAVDEAAAAAAAAAAADPALQADAKAAPTIGSADGLKRAVLRRYEPMSREAATAAVEARSAEPISATTLWALSGQTASKDEAAPADKKAAAAPRCLDGVRRAVKGAAAPQDASGC